MGSAAVCLLILRKFICDRIVKYPHFISDFLIMKNFMAMITFIHC